MTTIDTTSDRATAAQPSSPLGSTDDRFSCNICFDAVAEPVVTQCGHLYCWPCLYRWLAPGMTPPERQSLNLPPLLTPVNNTRRVCPVCKAPTSVPTVVPIYVRNLNDDNEEANNSSNNNNTNSSQPQLSQQQTATNPQSSSSLPTPTAAESRDRSHTDEGDERTSSAQTSNWREQPGWDPLDDLDDDVGLPVSPLTMAASTNNSPEIMSTATPSSSAFATGLRQRRGRASNTGNEEPATNSNSNPSADPIISTSTHEDLDDAVEEHAVPTRPAAHRSDPPPQLSTSTALAVRNGPVARPTAAQGIAMIMHQALLQAAQDDGVNHTTTGGATTTNVQQQSPYDIVPPLHYREDAFRNNNLHQAAANQNSYASFGADADPDSTEFLSRLLLGLSCFVLFCLWVF